MAALSHGWLCWGTWASPCTPWRPPLANWLTQHKCSHVMYVLPNGLSLLIKTLKGSTWVA